MSTLHVLLLLWLLRWGFALLCDFWNMYKYTLLKRRYMARFLFPFVKTCFTSQREGGYIKWWKTKQQYLQSLLLSFTICLLQDELYYQCYHYSKNVEHTWKCNLQDCPSSSVTLYLDSKDTTLLQMLNDFVFSEGCSCS